VVFVFPDPSERRLATLERVLRLLKLLFTVVLLAASARQVLL